MVSRVGLLILVSLSSDSFAQVTQAWVARYRGNSNSFETQDYGKGIGVDRNGNVLVTGWRGNPPQAFATVKYNSNGDSLWGNIYRPNGDYPQAANGLVVDSAGNAYVTGESKNSLTFRSDLATIKYTSSGGLGWIHRYPGVQNVFGNFIAIGRSGTVVAAGDYDNYPESDYDYVIIRYTGTGDTAWVRRYNGLADSTEILAGLSVDNNDNVIVTGSSRGALNGYDIVTVKYAPNGDSLWTRRYNSIGNYQDYASDIAVDAGGNVYVSGYGELTSDYITIKYSPSGIQRWASVYNNGGFDRSSGIAVDSMGNVHVTGWSAGSGTGNDYATVKYDSSGVQQWVRRFSSPGNFIDQAYDIAADASGNAYVTGESRTGSSGSTADYATIKYSATGDSLWLIRFNGPGNDYDSPARITVDPARNVYVTGVSAANILSSSYDMATVKYAQGPSGVEDKGGAPVRFALQQNYPNPFNPVTNFQFSIVNRQLTILKVYDLLGREVATLVNEVKQPGSYRVQWDASMVASGVYLYRLKAADFVETKKLLLLR